MELYNFVKLILKTTLLSEEEEEVRHEGASTLTAWCWMEIALWIYPS